MTKPALRFSVAGSGRDLKDGERFYRVELADGREVLIAATTMTARDGALLAHTDGEITLILAAGTWASVYMCEALTAFDSWSILHLPAPGSDGARQAIQTWRAATHDRLFQGSEKGNKK